jgi:hypothetical protein
LDKAEGRSPTVVELRREAPDIVFLACALLVQATLAGSFGNSFNYRRWR